MNTNEMVFVRKFRWTFEGDNLPSMFMNKVNFNFQSQEINFSYYEVHESERPEYRITEWLKKDLKEEKMTFIAYDGCGVPVYKLIFADIKLISDKVSFDYEDINSSSREISLIYKKLERIEDKNILIEQPRKDNVLNHWLNIKK